MTSLFGNYFYNTTHSGEPLRDIFPQIRQAPYICMFNGSGSMRGPNSRAGVTILEKIFDLYPRTVVSTFGQDDT